MVEHIPIVPKQRWTSRQESINQVRPSQQCIYDEKSSKGVAVKRFTPKMHMRKLRPNEGTKSSFEKGNEIVGPLSDARSAGRALPRGYRLEVNAPLRPVDRVGDRIPDADNDVVGLARLNRKSAAPGFGRSVAKSVAIQNVPECQLAKASDVRWGVLHAW